MGKRNQKAKSAASPASGHTWLVDVTVFVSCIYLGMYLLVALLRISYPYELEWMEGGAVDHVARILNGQAIYVKPSIDFVPYIYTPLYYYICAVAAKLTGIGFLPLRLVSFLSSLGCFFIIFWWVRRETDNWRLGMIAAGLYAASFRLCGAWFDIARADSLFILLMLYGAYLLRFAESKLQLVLAALAFWLSFLSKQTAQFICAPLVLYAFIAHRVRGFLFGGVLVGAIAGSVVILDWLHDGWFTYYIFRIPSLHAWDSKQYIGFWLNDVLKHLAIVVLLYFIALIDNWRSPRKSVAAFNALLLGGCFAASWLSRLHTGGYDNVLMPIAAGLPVVALSGPPDSLPTLRKPQRWMYNMVSLLLLSQLLILWYNPTTQVPTRSAKEAGQTIVQAIRSYPGDVYMPYHGFLPFLAGKNSHAQRQAQGDVERADSTAGAEMKLQLAEAFMKRRFSLIILDSPIRGSSFEKYYTLDTNMPSAVMSLWPVTGLPTRPRFWYVLRE